MSLPPADPQAAACLAYVEQLLREELQSPSPCCERLSIALGAVEVALTQRDAAKRAWPADLPARVDSLAQAFDGFVAELASGAALAAAPTPAAKVKAAADAVWSRLNKGSYSKDLQHAQHVYNFAELLQPGGPPPGLKKQLDCAGVVTVTFAACQALAQRFPAHADLAAARMEVSEDHCWIQLAGRPSREGSVEVTTDTAAKRGLPVAADAWAGWLYTGGQAVLCSPRQALAALATSINPAISGGKKGVDSEALQLVQRRLLEVLLAEAPDALYPAALCALADLREVEAQDQLEAARDAGDAAEVARLLQRRPHDPLDLFERAIALACCAGGGGNGGQGESSAQRGGGAAENGGCQLQAAGSAGAAAEPAADGEASQADGVPADGAAAAALAAESGGISSSSGADDPGRQWYVYSYTAAYLARRAEFLASCADARLPAGAGGLPEQEEQQPRQELDQQRQLAEQQPGGEVKVGQEQPAEQQAQHAQQLPAQQAWLDQAASTYRQALEAAGRGGGVLARYRFSPATDDQLFKDIEGVLEEVARDGLVALSKHGGGAPLTDPALLAPLLRLWDGVCWLYSGRAKPSAWVALLLRLAKLFSPEAREAAAAAAEPWVSSGPMHAARPLWRDLKPVPLRPLFESADVGGGGGGGGDGERAAKRQRPG